MSWFLVGDQFTPLVSGEMLCCIVTVVAIAICGCWCADIGPVPGAMVRVSGMGVRGRGLV